MRELEARFPKGLHYAIVYDTTPFIRESVNEVFHTLRDVRHPGGHRHPAVLARLESPAPARDRRGGVAGRDLRRHEPDGLHPEQPDAVRAGAGHRHRRGRRHRRAGEHRALAGQGPARARGHDQGHERDHRADLRHHAGAQLGAAAQRLPRRHHRPVLPPVRPDHLGVDDHLGHQRHDHDAGAGGLDLRRPQARPARRPGQGSAAVVELRPVRRAGDRVAAGPDAGRLAGPARGRGGRRGGARRPESHLADVGNLRASSSFPARSRAGRWAGS